MLRRLLLAADLLALLVAFAATGALQLWLGRSIEAESLYTFLAVLPAWALLGVAMGLYHAADRGLAQTTADEIGRVFQVATVWCWFLLVLRVAVRDGFLPLLPSLLVWALAIPSVLVARRLTRGFAHGRDWYRQKAALVGGPDDVRRVATRLARHPEWGVEVTHEVHLADHGGRAAGGDGAASDGSRDDDGAAATVELGSLQLEERLVELAQSNGISRVIFATPPGGLDDLTRLSCSLIEDGVRVDLVPGDAELLRSSADLHELEGLPVLSLPPARPPRSWGVLKRAFDLVVAVPALVACSPLIAYCALRIKLDSPGPVFFSQERAGRQGSSFSFVKLRSMVADAEERRSEVAGRSLHEGAFESGIFKAVDDPRVTGVGAWLRRYSLDELPQLWNVVKGDMSLVGPRPLPVVEDDRISGHYQARRELRPGITGPWQVMGRSDIPLEDMLKLDYAYAMNWSLGEDLKLLLRTGSAVLRGRGAY